MISNRAGKESETFDAEPSIAALFDIEGTILPISFVSDVLFPAALENLPGYVAENWFSTQGDFPEIRTLFPEPATASQEAFIEHCRELNSKNVKFPPWKTLQGILWRQLYQDGSVKAPLFADVLPAFQTLHDAGIAIYIYSSGSIEAQKLLFAHTNYGDITRLIKDCTPILPSHLIGDFDPSNIKVQNKFDPDGYKKIMTHTGIKNWTFFSDVPKEVGGAEEAGMNGYVVVRNGNQPIPDSEKENYKILTEGFVDVLKLMEK